MSKPASPAAPTPAASFYSPDTYRPEQSVGLMMRKVISALSRNIDLELASADLTNAQWVPLYRLYVGSARTGAELARECHLDAGAMTRLLDRLEAKGLCMRTRSETDRRVVQIDLTDAGRRAAACIPRTLSQVQNQLLSGFSEEEFAVLKSYLHRMLANVDPDATAMTPFIPGESHAA